MQAFSFNKPAVLTAGQILRQQCHDVAVANGEWADGAGKPVPRNPSDVLMRVITDLGDAAFASATPAAAAKHSALEQMLARAVIRIFDFAASRGLDLGPAIADAIETKAAQVAHKNEQLEAA